MTLKTLINFKVRRLSPTDPRPQFDCADVDLNEFFRKDSIESCKQLLAVTYAVEQSSKLVAFFSISNDSIKKILVPRSSFERITQVIPFSKRYSSLPAVKVGRLATCSSKQSNGIGSEVLNFMKGWFTEENKTGCRFIIVDAYNNPKTIRFYEKNGFTFLSQKDMSDETRLLYFDLFTFRP